MSKNKSKRFSQRDYDLILRGGFLVNNVILTQSEYDKLPSQFKTQNTQKLKGLRDDSRFEGFGTKDGYDMRRFSTWTKTQRKDLRDALKTKNYLNIREQSNTIAYIDVGNSRQRAAVAKTLGFVSDAVKTKHLKQLPIVKPAHIEPSDITVTYSKSARTLNVLYTKEELLNIKVMIDYKSIFNEMKAAGVFELEDDEISDYFAFSLRNQLETKLAPYNDGRSTFRPSTYAGDLSLMSYGAYHSLDGVIDQIVNIAEIYFDPSKSDGGLMITQVSVYRDISNNDITTKQEKTAYFDPPRAKKWGKGR